MPLPKSIVRLTAEERTELDDLIRRGKRAASVLLHARILLKADAGAGGPDGRVLLRPATLDTRQLKGLLQRPGGKVVTLKEMEEAIARGAAGEPE